MKQNIKNFNFCDFNFKQETARIKRNELSILNHYNLNVNDSTIKPVYGFSKFLKNKFGNSLVEQLFDANPNFEGKFVYITIYDFIDSTTNQSSIIIFGLTSNFELYEISFDNLTITSLNITFSSLPKVFENNYKFYFYSEGDKLICFDRNNSYVSVSNFIDLCDFINFQDKTFFVTKNEPFKVYYTEKLDIEDIDESLTLYDSIQLSMSNGKILKLINFKGNLFIIQQYAVSKLAGNESNYYLSSNCNVCTEIYDKTIEKVNDYIIFYTGSGLFLFDGNEIKHIFASATRELIVDSGLKSVIFNNKYYLFTKTKIENVIQNCLAEFDVYTNKFCKYFTAGLSDVYTLVSPNYYSLLISKNGNNRVDILELDSSSEISGNKMLLFNEICFDDNKLKSISDLKIITSGKFNLTISSDKFEKTFEIDGNTELDNIGILGYYFKIKIFGTNTFELKSMIFSVETVQN